MAFDNKMQIQGFDALIRAVNALATDTTLEFGDIRNYDVTTSSTAAQVSAAIQSALSDHNYAFIPKGDWSIGAILFTANKQRIVGAGQSTKLSYSGTGTGIDYAGYDHCAVENLRLEAPNAAIAVDIGDIAHYFKLINVVVNGSSTGNDISGTVSSGIGVNVERSYYGVITGCDVAFFTKGIYGFREFNGNSIVSNSIRQNYRGIHISDATSNSEGSQIALNQIESAESGTVAGIDIEGADCVNVVNNRVELTVASEAAIYLHGGTGAAQRNVIYGNMCIGTVDSLKIGTGTGSDNVINTTLGGGWYAGDVTINSDAKWTQYDFNNRMFGDGASAFTDSGASSIRSFGNDTAFTATGTGFTTSPTASWKYEVAKNIASLFTQTISATSNATTFTITGIPAIARPLSNSQTVLCITVDNGGTATISKGVIDTSGVLTLSKDVAGTAFTASGNKQFVGCTLTYPLT